MRRDIGFTLVEILVVIAIFAIVGTILVTVFANTLRGSNKSQILANIKQNGQAVLDTMDRTIREADNIVCVTPSGDTLVIVKDGLYTRFRFIGSTIANGSIQQDTPLQPPPPAAESDIYLFKRSLCTDDTNPLVNPTTLTDTNPQTGIAVVYSKDSIGNDLPIFDENPDPGYKNSLIIQFSLKPGIQTSSIITSQIDPVSFETTIGLR